MISKNLINIIVSLVILIVIVCVALRYCGNKFYTQADINAIDEKYKAKETLLVDSLEFARNLANLYKEQADSRTDSIYAMEHYITQLTTKHASTKTKIKPAPIGDLISDTGFVLAPNEYVNECEDCFNTLSKYKKENIQLRFERDSYDTLMRTQARIQETRIINLNNQKNELAKKLLGASKTDSIGVTRKLKLSAMGMLNDLFIPNGGGPGLIYEDKKFNEFGAHVLFMGKQKLYVVHIAKTISFKKKK